MRQADRAILGEIGKRAGEAADHRRAHRRRMVSESSRNVWKRIPLATTDQRQLCAPEPVVDPWTSVDRWQTRELIYLVAGKAPLAVRGVDGPKRLGQPFKDE